MNPRTVLVLALVWLPAIPCPARDPATPRAPAIVHVAFNDDCEPLLLNAISGARKDIHAAVFVFAKKSFADALIAAARRGVKVELKLDAIEAEFEYTQTLIAALKRGRVNVELVSRPATHARMHHKFAVIDGTRVVTGSYNWTRNATEENRENLVLIESPMLAQRFLAEWRRVGTPERR